MRKKLDEAVRRERYRSEALRFGNSKFKSSQSIGRRYGADMSAPRWLREFTPLVRKVLNELFPNRDWVTDHVLPVSAERATGLTVPTNLSYLPRRENILKKNHISDVDLDVIAAEQMRDLKRRGLAA